MGDMKITPTTYYQVRLMEGIYYPMIIKFGDSTIKERACFKKEGHAEAMFYVPDEGGENLERRSKCLNVKRLNHLKLSDAGEKDFLRAFIYKSLAEDIEKQDADNFSSLEIKNAREVPDYMRYFWIFGGDFIS